MSKLKRAKSLVGKDVMYEFGSIKIPCKVQKAILVGKAHAWKVEDHHEPGKMVLAIELKAEKGNPMDRRIFRVKYSDKYYRQVKKNQSDAG